MKLGIIISYDELQEGIRFSRELNLDTFQLRVKDASERTREEISAVKPFLRDFPADSVTAGWCAPAVWNFREGPATLGVVPKAYRENRMASLFRSIEIASELNIPLVQTHFGFIPENPSDAEYAGCVDCLRKLGGHAQSLGVCFCLETGQETPVTLRRSIVDAGSKALGVNMDAANLIMYGKGSPIESAAMLAPYLKSLHLKDGNYPIGDMYELGCETEIGKGSVPFPAYFAKLKEIGFSGPMFIEREIPLPKQREDIAKSIPYLREIARNAGL